MSPVVDIFKVATGTWSTAVLSQPRRALTATSLASSGVAIFAGGYDYISGNGEISSNVVDIFNVATGTWSTAILTLARGSFAATSLPDAGVAIFAGGTSRTSIDMCSSCCWMCLARGLHRLRKCGVLIV